MNKQKLLFNLNKLKISVTDVREGICIHAVDGFGVDQPLVLDWIRKKSTNWVCFSGDDQYPVPSLGEEDAEEFYCKTENLWVGEYGKLRYELLDFLIEELTKEIELEELV